MRGAALLLTEGLLENAVCACMCVHVCVCEQFQRLIIVQLLGDCHRPVFTRPIKVPQMPLYLTPVCFLKH